MEYRLCCCRARQRGKTSTQICQALCSSYMTTEFHMSVAGSQVRVPPADAQNL